MANQDPQHFTTAPVMLFADWQIFGDVDPHQYMAYKLDLAVEKGDINAYSILIAGGSGAFGLLYVYFTVDVDFTAEQLNSPKASGKAILNKIVGDTDVQVRWIGRRSLNTIVGGTRQIEEGQKNVSANSDDETHLRNLVNYVKEHQGVARTDLVEKWLPAGVTSNDLSRLIDKGKRRGFLVSQGRGRSALWYTIEQTS